MLVRDIELMNERIHIHFFDVDGTNETVVLFPAEALDILGWLIQAQPELLRLNAKHLQKIREEHVS